MTGTDQQQSMLTIYLNDHLAGATGGVELARRAAGSERGSPLGPPLQALAAGLAADRETLRELMAALDVGVTTYKVYAGWAAEKLGRFKLNGSWLSRSPLAPVIETEGLRLVVEANASVWRTLRALAETDRRLDAGTIDALVERAREQAEVVERLRRQASATAFGGRVLA